MTGQQSGRVTIVDVARAAGISVSSASVALRGEAGVSAGTRAHVLRTAQRLGYQPNERARRLRQQRSCLLGVTFALDQTFHTDLVEWLYRAVDGTSYDLVLSATTAERGPQQAIDGLLGDRCEALILVSPQVSERHLTALGQRTPVVVVGSDLHVDNVDSVRSDDARGVADAVGHLTALGHRAIAYVDGGTAVMSSVRRASYVAAMRKHGLGDQVQVISGAATEQAGIEAARRVLSGDPMPTAILTHNDMIAVGLLLTLRAHGVAVPDDVSVVGYDNSRSADLSTIQLTSVSQDTVRLAEVAVRRAIARTDGGPAADELVVPPRLIVRGSTGSAPMVTAEPMVTAPMITVEPVRDAEPARRT